MTNCARARSAKGASLWRRGIQSRPHSIQGVAFALVAFAALFGAVTLENSLHQHASISSRAEGSLHGFVLKPKAVGQAAPAIGEGIPVGGHAALPPTNGTDPWVETAYYCTPWPFCYTSIYHLNSYTHVPTGAPTDDVGQLWSIWIGEQNCYTFCIGKVTIIQTGIAWQSSPYQWCDDQFIGYAVFVAAEEDGGSSCSDFQYGWAPTYGGDHIYMDVNDMQVGGSYWEAEVSDENTGYGASLFGVPMGSGMTTDFITEEVYNYPGSNCNSGLWPSPTQETFTPISTLNSPSWQVTYPNSYCDEKVNAVSNSVTLYWA